MIRSETYLQAKKRSYQVDQLLERSFPKSRVKRVGEQIEACAKDEEATRIFNKACKKLQNITNDLGNSILHEAVLKGYKDLCRLFAHQGLGRCKNYEEEIPLHLAIRVDSLFAFSILIQSDSSLLAENRFCQTAAEIALSLDRVQFLKRLFKRVDSLDALVPKSRQVLFLKALWNTEDAHVLRLVAKRFFARMPQIPTFVLEFSSLNREIESSWLLTPQMKADELQFSMSEREWDIVLYHFLGRRAESMIKDPSAMEDGSFVQSMYPVILWTWRAFWQSKQNAEALFIEIDKAIGSILYRSSSDIMKVKIKEGRSPVVIPSGWIDHSVSVVFFGSYLFLCNTGEKAESQEHNVTCYRINKDLITSSIIKRIKQSEGSKRKGEQFLFVKLPQILNGSFDSFCNTMHQSLQPSDLKDPICVAKNLRLAIRSILLAKLTPRLALATYHEYVQFSRYSILEQYVNQKNKKSI